MTEPFIGQIQSFGFNFAPVGWQLCAGQTLSIAANTALFSLLGTYYGGDGTTTFKLPDLQGRIPIGQGQGPGLQDYIIGEASGTETITLLTSQLPMHTHLLTGGSGSVMVSDQPGTTPTPTATANTLAALNDPLGTATNNAYNNLAPNITLNTGSSGGGGGTISVTGGSQPFSIMQPYLTINFSIALEGLYPSRN